MSFYINIHVCVCVYKSNTKYLSEYFYIASIF